MGYALNDPAGATTYNYAYNTSGDTYQDSFYQKLAEDIYPSCTYRHTESDFAGTFCDGYIHNIHNTNTTHYQ